MLEKLRDNDNPILAALAEVSTAAMIGATVGRIADAFREGERTSGSTFGAGLGLVAGLLFQLRKLDD